MKCVIKTMSLLMALTLVARGGTAHNDSAPKASSSASSATSASSEGPTSSASSDTTAPSIVTQPVAQSVVAPTAAVFSVTASGAARLTYQWRSSTNGSDWTDISGATAASYNTGATAVRMNGRYYSVVVSSTVGPITSAPVKLTVSTSSFGAGTLLPLLGVAVPLPHTDAPLSTGVTSGAMPNLSIISRDPKGYGFILGLTDARRVNRMSALSLT